VLVFHHVGKPAIEETGANVRYFYSIERFQNLVQDCQHDGRCIAPLPELIRRLKENPRSLYFEKTLAISFDDGYVSLYACLEGFLQKGHIPFTVFVPTAYAGKSNEWDHLKGIGHEDILDWRQLAALREKGADIGSHSRHHPRLTECDPEARRYEITGSFEDLKGFLPDSSGFLFSYPFGAYNDEIRETVKSAGYMGAVANFAGNIRPRTDPFQIPRFTVFAEDDWKGISTRSRSLWIKELLKDIRDWAHR
jgi:peptidoglycan/xylan/chitin deacetylase (PgdA/CDA1 family)